MKAKKLVILLIVLAVVLAGSYLIYRKVSQNGVDNIYRTQRVTNGQLRIAVGATGTINPVMVVNVGTQISGTIQELYVDFNDKVEAGQLLMILDDQLFKAKVDMSKANLANSMAQLKLAQLKFDRQEKLYQAKTSTKEEFDTAQANLEMAKATVAQHEASMAQDLYNLNNTRIISPVDGVVINRGVDVGQTVAASFQTPTLINIAGDLTKMQINASFAEADIGSLVPGLDVIFTVDAFPGDTFSGKLRQIRLNPTITSNVVTYDVVIDVENPDLKLLPGMTAYVDIELYREDNVLLVPNSALNYRPTNLPATPPTPKAQESNGSEAPKAPNGAASQKPDTPNLASDRAPQRENREKLSNQAPDNQGQTVKEQTPQEENHGKVYVQDPDGKIRPLELTLGATDLRFTIVKSGGLKSGDFVVIGENLPAADRTLMSTGMGPGGARR
ncbi:MAG: efflux RND transporter periplasmic adaptor subunit [Deltaproteobacteria bacterium]|jgi:HlyD family secretion protein|nr:efflux RND transporter periplasmic adaptor subunit [Deltaproteobacteria bacterium]